jgi:hypothetical protein
MRFNTVGLGLLAVGILLLGAFLAFHQGQALRAYAPERSKPDFILSPVTGLFGGAIALVGLGLIIANRRKPKDRAERKTARLPRNP